MTAAGCGCEAAEVLHRVAAVLGAHGKARRHNGGALPADLADLLAEVLLTLAAASAPVTSRQDRSGVGDSAFSAEASPVLISFDRAAAVLDVSRSTLDREVRAGRLPAVRIGGCRRISVADLREYVTHGSDQPEAGA